MSGLQDIQFVDLGRIGQVAEPAQDHRHAAVENGHVPSAAEIHQHDLAALACGDPRPQHAQPTQRRDIGAHHAHLGLVERIADLRGLRSRKRGEDRGQLAVRLRDRLDSRDRRFVRKRRNLAQLLDGHLRETVAILGGRARHPHKQGRKRHRQHHFTLAKVFCRRRERLHERRIAVNGGFAFGRVRRLVLRSGHLAGIVGRRHRAANRPERAIGDGPGRSVLLKANAADAVRFNSQNCNRILHANP